VTPVLYRIEHETRYVHTGGVSTSQHVAYLRPRALPYQQVRWDEVEIDPQPATRVHRHDYFGNHVDQFTILTPYDEMRVVGRSMVAVSEREPIAADAPPWETVRDDLFYRRGAPYESAVEFSYSSPYVATAPELAAFALESFAGGRSLLDAAVELMHRIHDEFTFDPGSTTITTPVTRVLADRHGVCQDFAHLHIGCLRSLGLAARYVSGYLLTDPPPGQPRLVGADASHAWVSVWDPPRGWVDLDPTNDVRPSQRHVTLAWGRDYGDVSPLRGVVLGGGRDHTLHVGVSVMPATEDGTPSPSSADTSNSTSGTERYTDTLERHDSSG
jgi:transglutaminase-like putative cysteine protease